MAKDSRISQTSDLIPQLDEDLQFTGLSGKINVEGIINYVLYQITVAKTQGAEESYGELVEFLEMFMSPYKDIKYTEEIKELKEDIEKQENSIHPKQRTNIVAYMFRGYVDRKFEALIKLLDRNNLLLDKEMREEIL